MGADASGAPDPMVPVSGHGARYLYDVRLDSRTSTGTRSSRAIPFFIAGGDPPVQKGTYTTVAATVDVAPTVGRTFGVGKPRGG